MATRGVTQLLKLKLFYSDTGGSSRSVRKFISTQLVDWCHAHPETQVEVIRKNRRHPYIEGEYLTTGLKHTNQHQICVKNVDTSQEIANVCDMLANRSGRKITKIVAPVLTDTPSIQGVWTPYLNLQHEPNFPVSIIPGRSPALTAPEEGQEDGGEESTTDEKMDGAAAV